MGKFTKGTPKPPGSGRKKGQVNRSTREARERLADHGCNLDLALANAIMAKDTAMIEALAKILGYYQPKFSDQAPPAATQPEANTTPEDTATLLQLAKT